jgi:hypothetical protein
MVLNERSVQRQLRFSPFKITDSASTLLGATEKFGYLRRLENRNQNDFNLTEKGIPFVSWFLQSLIETDFYWQK